MTASNPSPSILESARFDPIGAGIIVCVTALLVLVGVHVVGPLDHERPWLKIRWPELLGLPRAPPRPLQAPPTMWRTKALPGDVFAVPSYPVAYWGRPDATYGLRPTSEAAKPAGIVVHFTDETEVLRLVRYGHRTDPGRGNAAYGYHFYIDQEGRIIQGAPMSKRTNHIKPLGHPARTKTAGHLDGGNSIALSLVGACKSPPLIPITYRCNEETISDQQHAAAVALVTALRKQYGVGCRSVYGHGELQTDRKSFEGLTIAQAMRAKC